MKKSKVFLLSFIIAFVLAGCSNSVSEVGNQEAEAQKEQEEIALSLANYISNDNSQAKAWIKIDGTNIDDPDFQAEDNLYWLRRDEDGSYSVWGCYFADYEADLTGTGPSRNTVIYGHSSLNDETEGKRFTELKKFGIQEFAEEHRYFLFGTKTEEYVATIFSVGYWPDSAQYLYANPSDQAFEELIEGAREHSIYRYDTEVGKEDRIITLSTCTGNDQERFVVMAKLSDHYEGSSKALEVNPSPKGA